MSQNSHHRRPQPNSGSGGPRRGFQRSLSAGYLGPAAIAPEVSCR